MAAEGQARRRADGERNRARVLAAAAEHLAADPDAPVAAIADAAKLSRKSVYAHFPSRESLVAALLEEDVQRIGAALASASLEDGPADAALERGRQAMAGSAMRLRSLRVVYDQVLGPATVRARRREATKLLIEVLRRGQRDGTFRGDLPPDLIEALADALSRTFSEAVDAGGLSPADIPLRMADAMRRLLAPHPPADPAPNG